MAAELLEENISLFVLSRLFPDDIFKRIFLND